MKHVKIKKPGARLRQHVLEGAVRAKDGRFLKLPKPNQARIIKKGLSS